MAKIVELEQVIENVSPETLTAFFHAASKDKFRPGRQDRNYDLAEDQDLLESLDQLGQIEFNESDTLIILAGKITGDMTRRSSRTAQYKIAKDIIKQNSNEAAIFVFYDDDGRFRFSLVTALYSGKKRKFTSAKRYTYYVAPSEPHRTFLERVGGADFSSADSLLEAFSVEPVTREFDRVYRDIFEQAEGLIGKTNNLSKDIPEQKETLRLYTQSLFNRLMFLRFIEKKDWLKLAGQSENYLAHLFLAGGLNGQSFFVSRLVPLFFRGLAIKGQQELTAIGKVPFLNGGLFEKNEEDNKITDIPDDVFQSILHATDGLFYRFNFTIEESTPMDIEVAVDPEMLGKIFEELVTGRHESGSYYTPRPIVSFMCREALKSYLTDKTSTSSEAIEALVDNHAVLPKSMNDQQADEIKHNLRMLKACDPACGSGAYLLGLMQEIIAIHQALRNQAIQQDSQTLYDLKLNIISENLYGADIDPFATNIAKLRLWLSLAVEADTPIPLPNLDFKIETGNALTGRFELGGQMFQEEIGTKSIEIARLEDEYMRASDSIDKVKRKKEIDKKIAYLRKMLHADDDEHEDAIVWNADFAQAFVPRCTTSTTMDGKMGFMAEVAQQKAFKITTFDPGGFDIVLANPPYIRQELIKDIKPRLKDVFGNDLYSGTADLYTYFYARAVQILAPGGVLSFISSNKFFRANYGKKLRKYLAEKTHVLSITDFGELPVFETAATFPMIFVAKKTNQPKRTVFTQVKSLAPPYPNVKKIVKQTGSTLPNEAINGEDWGLIDSDTFIMLRKMESSGIPLNEYVNGEIFRGILTGFNEAFVIDSNTRDQLIAEDPKSDELIKSMCKGDDVRKWHIRDKNRWLIFTRRGVDIDKYPAIKRHLEQYCKQLEPKPNNWPSGKKWPGRKPGSYKWFEIQDNIAYYKKFDKPKIIFPVIAKEPRFTLAPIGMVSNDKTFILAIEDLFLVGVLNSQHAWDYLKTACSVLGDSEKGGRLELRSIYMENFPIPTASDSEKQEMSKLVQKCLDAEGDGCEKWEAEINRRVAKLYGLEE
jgi:type I restriction-modification system DNA methylase subunit